MPDWIGKTIGKVRIDRLLAKGGMAEVYLGTHLTLDRPVAVKVLHSYVEDDPDLRERLQREAKVVAGFRHPSIVQVYDFDTIDGHPYIVMEYLNGPTLAVFLSELRKKDKRLPMDHVVQILKGPASALDYAHALGVIHRDVKPGNIMLHGSPDDTSPGRGSVADLNAVMTDFGLLHVTGATHMTSVGTIAGTPHYMSPEQASGEQVDFRSDIYSLGVVLYEMLAGRAPFDGDSSLTVMYKQIHEAPPPIEHISARQQAVIDRALAKKPEDRYVSSAEMMEELKAAIAAAAQTVRAYGSDVAEAIPEEPTRNIAAPPAMVQQPRPAPVAGSAPARHANWVLPVGIAAALMLALAAGAIVMIPRLIGAMNSAAQEEPTAAATSTASATAAAALPSSDGMAQIEGADYQVGAPAADDFHAGPQTVSLKPYWIDKLVVTNALYQAYMAQTGAQAPQIWPAEPKRPVRGVTWDEANAYCTWMNKRLPAEAEWEVAGRGPSGSTRQFPWGDDPTDGGRVLQMPDQDTYEVGSLDFNASPFGVLDLVGNVWQWVGDTYAPAGEGLRILRGGRFGLPQDLSYRVAVAPADNRYVKFAGFRCAADQTR